MESTIAFETLLLSSLSITLARRLNRAARTNSQPSGKHVENKHEGREAEQKESKKEVPPEENKMPSLQRRQNSSGLENMRG